MNIDQIDEFMETSDIDLSSFDLQDTLNPEFWKNNKLNPYIRRALLMIARDFVSDLSFDINVKDVVFTGSLANYNWNKQYSDIDLHIIIDFDDMEADSNIVANLFKSIKTVWNDTHKNINISGYPVELYVQDIKETHKATGIYSILNDEWIKKPTLSTIKNDNIDTDDIKEQVAYYCNRIDQLVDTIIDETNSHTLELLYDECGELFDDIKKERTDGISQQKSEMSEGNIIFKTLRRNGYIGKLLDIRTECYDKMRSFK